MRAKICIYIWGFENFPVQKPLIFLRVFALKIQNHCRKWVTVLFGIVHKRILLLILNLNEPTIKSKNPSTNSLNLWLLEFDDLYF